MRENGYLDRIELCVWVGREQEIGEVVGGGGQVCFPFYNSVIVLNSVDIMYNVCYHLFQ